MPAPVQLSLPFACLDFYGRSAVTASEVADKLGCTALHIVHLIEDGTMVAIDAKRHEGSKRMMRVPVDEYRRYVISRLTGPARSEFIAELPEATLRELQREIAARLAA